MSIGKIIGKNEKYLMIKMDEEINENYMKLLADGGSNWIDVRLIDNRPRSVVQNALSHALIRDIARSQLDDPRYIEEVLKYEFYERTGIDFFHSVATIDEARKWISFLIDLMLEFRIPFKKRYAYLFEDSTWFYQACKHRVCAVCGKEHADIHHITAVGNRKRKLVDHRLFPMVALCREHHQKAHELGQILFIKQFKIIPVYLSGVDLVKIGIMSNAQIKRLDEVV